ncbi:hypothetical protein Tco_0631547 [Tanacetum coccineum]
MPSLAHLAKESHVDVGKHTRMMDFALLTLTQQIQGLTTDCHAGNPSEAKRYLSDHRPILLRESRFDYGPSPFRFYHHWLEVDGFNNFVEDMWSVAPGNNSNPLCSMAMKLKFLKLKIKEWNQRNMQDLKSGKAKLKEDLEALDADIDKGNGTADMVTKRSEMVNSLQEIDKLQAMEIAQKAKIKWCIEGDENSSFFHGMLNKRRSQLSICGIMVDGVWIEDPLNIDLECDVTKEELKKAVWDYGIDKSPGPDGFTFGFYHRFWSTIQNDVFEAVKYFFNSDAIPNGCNSTFIALIPKIPDANLVKDFRPISLIGSMYKIIAKILANHLVGVLGDIVNERMVDADFYSQNSSLWARVMKAIHGDDGRIGKDIKACNQSCWLNIVNEINVLKNQGINFLDFMRLKLGNENNISFWNDNWIGGNTLKYLYPRIYALENSKQVTVYAKLADIALDASFRQKPRGGIECIQFNEMLVLMQDVSLTPISDRWIWSLEGSGDFSVASTRKAIDDKRLSVVNSKTRWIKYVPIKVNVHAWKVKLDALPTRFNISHRAVMYSTSSAVTYTSVYTDSEPGRVFWGADEEISDRDPEEPQTPLVPQDEDEREPMFIQAHDPDYVPEPVYPEYIPLEDEHVFLAEEQPLPPVDSPTAESPEYVAELDPEEDPYEYEDDETKDGPVDYPMNGGDDGDDDDDDLSGDDADDEDEDDDEEKEEEHLARLTLLLLITVRLQASISLLPEAEVERLLAMTTPSLSPPISLSPPSTGERLTRCTAPPAHSSPPPALIDAVTAALPLPPLPPLPPSLYIPPPADRRDDIPESEQPPRKRLCLSTLGSRYEIRESSTDRPTRGRGVDYRFVSTVDAEARRQGISEVGYGIRDTWVDPVKAVFEVAPMTVGEVNTRVTELTELHEHDTQDLYALLEDAQDGRTRISQRVAIDSQRMSQANPSGASDPFTLSCVCTHRPKSQYISTAPAARQVEMAALRESDHRRHALMAKTLRVIRDMRREMSDMQAELLAHREQQRRARQPGLDARILDHQDASRDVDSHI